MAVTRLAICGLIGLNRSFNLFNLLLQESNVAEQITLCIVMFLSSFIIMRGIITIFVVVHFLILAWSVVNRLWLIMVWLRLVMVWIWLIVIRIWFIMIWIWLVMIVLVVVIVVMVVKVVI